MTITVVATDGEQIKLSAGSAGLQTGFARIGNPYFDGDEYWRMKDGDTCIECEADHPAAMPVADAYQQLFGEWAEERAEWARIEREEREAEAEAEAVREWDETDGPLYDIQDKLMGVV